MKSEIFFPYGVSNFAEIVREDFVYVDKTAYIELLEKKKEKRVAYLRPRRFGKSLFLSLLEHYYDLNRKADFQKLFSKYYIGKNPTNLANSYRILFFNFSGIDTTTADKAQIGFNDRIFTSVKTFLQKYQLFDKEAQNYILSTTYPELLLNRLFANYFDEKIPIYLLIDEYDHFTNEILVRNLEEFKQTVSQNGYVWKFYEVIKNATQQGIVDRFFITGVSPITLDSLTSGFNIVTHLTHEELFETMMGFSEQEVRNLLNMVLQDTSRADKIMQDLRDYYNGYKFYPFSQENIYNSDMVLYFLKYFKDEQRYPRQMLDPNIMPDYGKLKAMFRVANWQANVRVLQEILENGVIDSELIYQFSFEKPFGKKEFINFLFYLGNLTIHSADFSDTILFKIPNKVIEELYWQYYAQLLQEWSELSEDEDVVRQAVREMALSGNTSKFFGLIEKLLQSLSNRDFIQFDEKQVKMAIMAYLVQANIFDVRSEQEISKGGYLDLRLFIKPNNPFKHHQFIWELKYLKKEEEHLLSETLQEARNQVLGYYQKDESLQSKEMLHLWAVVVVKDKVFAQEVYPISR
ncbi:MAG: ATP-binding protein [Raineya sp.]|nr:ATP-binding protein [Raineya sp.]